MNRTLTAPFFEIGPKNLLRRPEIEAIAKAAGRAGAEHGVTVLLTVPTALVAPVSELVPGVRVLAQGMDLDRPGPSMHRVTAESLADAGASGVMLNHEAAPLGRDDLAAAISRAAELDLLTVVCASDTDEAEAIAALGPSVVLLEPPDLIGSTDTTTRDWIQPCTQQIHRAGPGVLAMHAGGVAAPSVAESIMTAGADGTGSTSGILNRPDPTVATRDFIAATRAGWDDARARAAGR